MGPQARRRRRVLRGGARGCASVGWRARAPGMVRRMGGARNHCTTPKRRLAPRRAAGRIWRRRWRESLDVSRRARALRSSGKEGDLATGVLAGLRQTAFARVGVECWSALDRMGVVVRQPHARNATTTTRREGCRCRHPDPVPQHPARHGAVVRGADVTLKLPYDFDGLTLIASVSGGKDSTALMLALREAELPHLRVFADTEWEAPETYRYLDVLRNRLGPIDVVGVPGGMRARAMHRA